MSAHVRIIELIKQMPSIFPFSQQQINSMIQEHECLDFLSFDIKITLKTHFFLLKNNKILLLCMY